MKEYVLGFMFDENKEHVALIRKENPEWQRGLLNGIGGKIEPGESPFDAMVREFKEETGVYNWEWTHLLKMHEDGEFVVHVYCAFTDDVFSARTVEAEEVEVFDVDIDFGYIRNKSISNVPWLIMACLDSDVLEGFAQIDCRYR